MVGSVLESGGDDRAHESVDEGLRDESLCRVAEVREERRKRVSFGSDL